MPNSIRTPRRGTTNHSRVIAEAVDDEEWQKFRIGLKGRSTNEKVDRLQEYHIVEMRGAEDAKTKADIDIRVDNYLKALARGGLIVPEASTDYVPKLLRGEIQVIK